MSDQILISRDEDVVTIKIEGVGAAIGFFEVLIASKFQPGITWKNLMNPSVNEALAALLAVIRADNRFSNFPQGGDLLAAKAKDIDLALTLLSESTGRAVEELRTDAIFPYGPKQ